MRPLRIALVHPYSFPEVKRGGERYLHDLAWFLSNAGHRVEMITGTAGTSSTSLEGAAKHRRLRHLPNFGRLTRREIAEGETFGARVYPVLLRRRFDIVHALMPSAAIAARLARQRTVYTQIGHPTPELAAAHPTQARLLRKAVGMANVSAAYSEASAAATQLLCGRRVIALPPGVVLDRFPMEAAARTGPPRILFAAYASNPEKGLGVLVRAFRILLGSMPDARLVVAGPGEAAWAFDALDGDRERVMRQVELLGPVPEDEVTRLYRSCSVTTLPSTNEAFGIVLIESLASGTPVVCSAAGGMPEIVDRPTIGRAVPYGDADALAHALAETIALARDPLTPRRCREHAGRWGWRERIGPLHEELYQGIVEGRRPAG